MNIEELEPTQIWHHFKALCAIPRLSGHEALARQYTEQVALSAGATYQEDAYGNVVIHSRSYDCHPHLLPLAIQAHLDMVGTKLPSSSHNFLTDPIHPIVRLPWVAASGTTLGADNGIGVAMALALLSEPSLSSVPIELIFTVQEETGLYGAAALDPAMLSIPMLINLDSEDPRELIIGCAGGCSIRMQLPQTLVTLEKSYPSFEVSVSGLTGGHSGVEIHKNGGNAIKILAQLLSKAAETDKTFRLASISGGTVHNAIPREANATIVVLQEDTAPIIDLFTQYAAEIRAGWQQESIAQISITNTTATSVVMDASLQQKILTLLTTLQHGVIEYSQDFPGKVQTSANVALVHTTGSVIEVITSFRSLHEDTLKQLHESTTTLAHTVGATTNVESSFSGWTPNPNSPLLQLTTDIYTQLYKTPPSIQITHGGLECGVLASKVPSLDIISFGPLIVGAHTPEEAIDVASVQSTWQLLICLIQRITEQTSHKKHNTNPEKEQNNTGSY